ncbi:hypothetical protein [Candidatus Poriferisocius sp.]|uniref:hypothetical protein n=1 Tax=Candidatus Poriferisocius sp. TaxID=3101276 RepID=UPI003B02BA71
MDEVDAGGMTNESFRDLENRLEEAKLEAERSGRDWMDVLPEFIGWEELVFVFTDLELAFPEESDMGDYIGSVTNRQLAEEAIKHAEGNVEWHGKYSDYSKYPWAREVYPAPLSEDEKAAMRELADLADSGQLPGRQVGKADLFTRLAEQLGRELPTDEAR